MIKKILQNRVVGIVADEHEGKTNTMFYFLDACLLRKRSVVCYFYHREYKEMLQDKVTLINNLDELERVRDSFVFIDEFKELFQLDNRKFITQVERVFNLLLHNNNVLILAGVPNYYKKFIAGRVRQWVIKGITYKNCINGSALKNYLGSLSGDFVGATRLDIPIDKMLVNGVFLDVPYLKKYDKKDKNVNLFSGWTEKKGVEWTK